MLEYLRRTVGLWYARWTFRKSTDQQQPFNEFFSRAQSILLLLPVGYEEAVIAGNALKTLKSIAQKQHVTIVTSGTRITPLSGVIRSEVIRLDDVDLNAFMLPRATILQRVLTRTYDVAIDLNLDFVLHAAYICKASRATVRVGLTPHHADGFFNVQLNVHRSQGAKAAYDQLVRYLTMF